MREIDTIKSTVQIMWFSEKWTPCTVKPFFTILILFLQIS